MVSPEVLEAHQVLVGGDNAFQRRARLLQALWREEQRFPVGLHRGAALGSRLAMPGAREHLWNYLSEGARDAVTAEVLAPDRDTDKLYSQPRIFEDLLSSQPRCFNLFGELRADLDLATSVCAGLWPDRVAEVTGVEFEHSPGRGDPRYLGNRSAHDVLVRYRSPSGATGFLGVEVKYHENLRVKAATHKPRYDEVAEAAGCFRPDALEELRHPPLQQLWLDHLLALSMVQAGWYLAFEKLDALRRSG